MKKLLFLITVSLILTACFGKKAPKPAAEALNFAVVKTENGKAKLEMLKGKPDTEDPDDMLFVKVNPGTVTVGTLSSVNDESYFIMTKPVTQKQLSNLIGEAHGENAAISVPFDSIGKVLDKLSKENPDVVFSLPSAKQWDFAFLSGKINENEQPICWEWATMNGSSAYTWRGRIWHIMELYEEAEKERSTDLIQSDLSFRIAFKEKKPAK